MPTIVKATAFALALVLVMSLGRAMAQDAAVVAPEVYKVLFENERVRILEWRDQPGQKSAMHSHPHAPSEILTKFSIASRVGPWQTHARRPPAAGQPGAVS